MSQRNTLPDTGASRSSNANAATGQNNLFRSQLTRRPTASVTSTAETRLDVEVLDTSEIVVRDQHGEIEFRDPPTPGPDESGQLADMAEKQREERQLAEAIKSHRPRCVDTHDPEELLEVVRTSLRAKVAALADDEWMFEGEDQPR